MTTSQHIAQKQPNRILHLAKLDIDSQPQQYRLSGIICTIGPATNSVEKLMELKEAGMNCVRLNFSHGSYEFHESIINNAKEAARRLPESPLAIALDTKGPEIRMGQLLNDQEITLEKGKEITVTVDDARKANGDISTIYVDYKNLPKVVPIGGLIFIDDGLVSLEVLEKSELSCRCKILNSGKLGSRKGVNLPNCSVDLPAVAPKDIEDIRFGMKHGIDMIFASFIRKAADVKAIRDILGEAGKNVHIIAKIENHEGVERFDEILEVVEGVMVARGDLGIEIPPEKVFLAQKMMISRCNLAGKSVIVATQMLESMTYNPRPTRAEVSDVANAVLDGADCVMLSGESAKGNYPVETVRMMAQICKEAEGAFFNSAHNKLLRESCTKPLSIEEATASAAVSAAFESDVSAIVCLTTSGNTGRLLSKYRPPCPILCVTRSDQAARQLHLYRGCVPLHFAKARGQSSWQEDVDARIKYALDFAKSRHIVRVGDTVIAIQGWTGGVGNTNTFRLLSVE